VFPGIKRIVDHHWLDREGPLMEGLGSPMVSEGQGQGGGAVEGENVAHVLFKQQNNVTLVVVNGNRLKVGPEL